MRRRATRRRAPLMQPLRQRLLCRFRRPATQINRRATLSRPQPEAPRTFLSLAKPLLRLLSPFLPCSTSDAQQTTPASPTSTTNAVSDATGTGYASLVLLLSWSFSDAIVQRCCNVRRQHWYELRCSDHYDSSHRLRYRLDLAGRRKHDRRHRPSLRRCVLALQHSRRRRDDVSGRHDFRRRFPRSDVHQLADPYHRHRSDLYEPFFRLPLRL